MKIEKRNKLVVEAIAAIENGMEQSDNNVILMTRICELKGHRK